MKSLLESLQARLPSIESTNEEAVNEYIYSLIIYYAYLSNNKTGEFTKNQSKEYSVLTELLKLFTSTMPSTDKIEYVHSLIERYTALESAHKDQYQESSKSLGAVVVLRFKMGYMGIGFGSIEGSFFSKIFVDNQVYEEIWENQVNWYKFVDIRSWNLMTFMATMTATDINKKEIKIGLKEFNFLVSKCNGAEIIVSKIQSIPNLTVNIHEQLSSIKSSVTEALFTSELLDVKTYGNCDFIMNT